MSPAVRVATVVPHVSGLDKVFDYVVPDDMVDAVQVGTMVRVALAGRRVGGWVSSLDDDPHVSVERLHPIAKVSGAGPSAEVVDLARWASVRWGAGRLRPFLVSASPDRIVPAGIVRATPTLTAAGARRRDDPLGNLLGGPGGVVRVTPTEDLADTVERIVERSAGAGTVLVVHPSPATGSTIAAALRRRGRSTVTWPEQWAAAAAGGVDVVIGGRAAVWATLGSVGAIVVLDEHDESLQDERTPTWAAPDVAVERARRLGIPVVLVSPAPTVRALAWSGRRWLRPSPDVERRGWPAVEIVDRTDDEPWRRSLVTSRLVEVLRHPDLRVACVHNSPGRSRLLACRRCRAIVVCERCAASVVQTDAGTLSCRRCGTERPPVCQSCGSGALANVKPGVTRLREELEAAAARPVLAVTGTTEQDLFRRGDQADVVVGTEAVLHRMRDVDVVTFVDLDAELLAPRYRAAEQAMALLVRAARLVGPDGTLLVQTHVPDHEVLDAVRSTDPGRLARSDAARRRVLGLPPFGALARLSGDGADALAVELGLRLDVEVAPERGGASWLVRAADPDTLGAALTETVRGVPARPGNRTRVEVDPLR
jgi:primosomal protein N' (replication factor Y)